MPNGKQQQQDLPSSRESAATRFMAFLPMIIFIAVLAVFTGYWLVKQSEIKSARLEVGELNEARGLPRDYPSDVVPVHEGVQLLETERGTADARDGGRLDKWFIHGELEGERKDVLDFYNDLLISKGMGQTTFISMPSHDGSGPNYAVAWSNEEYLVDLSIEKLKSDDLAQFKLTVYRPR